MQCPKCQTENPNTRKFCRDCGSKLLLICPKCNSENIPGDKFCGECGHNLSQPSEPTPKELTFDEKLEKIQKYLPGGLTEKILSQRGKIEGERKQVTVMFADMQGFTPLVEKLGPEEAYSIMDQVYEILIHSVLEYEGTVNEMTGDGIMALFGAPLALEDAPQRAIRSALSIHRQMARLNDKFRSERKEIPSLRMRIGIHSGPVVVGTLGNDLRVEFKAVGDTVNLASRMEGLAEPGATYVTENTFKLTEGLFRFEGLGAKKIKGMEDPVNAYRVIAASSRRTRFDVNAEQGLTPFVGRERELEILLDGFEVVRSGRGQAFSIVAEAGAGKSRLLYEFRKAVENEDITILEGKCLSYASNVAYLPVIDILKANFRIEDGNEPDLVKSKVSSGLTDMGIDQASTLPYLLDLLSVKGSGIDELNITSEIKKERIIESLHRIVLKGSEQRPLLLIFEDLHWVDGSTEILLKDILETIPGSKVLLLFSYRPEYVHTWGGKSYHNQLNLNRLSNRESLNMLSHLLGSDAIEEDVKELVLSKTEGIPFFIEEFVKSLTNLKLIEKREKICLVKDIETLTIPSTIQDMIMARVDALPDRAKEVLQAGSVIEREFSLAVIKQVLDLPEQELLTSLALLKDSELIYERGIYPDSTYIFKHALTREVVYDSILAKRKTQLHENIGMSLETLFKENIEEHYESLVEHFVNSRNYNKAAYYSRLAGRKARRSFSNHESIAFQRKAISCYEQLPQTDDTKAEIIHSRVSLGGYYMGLNYHVEAKEIVEPILELASQTGFERYLSQIWSIMSWYYMAVESDMPKSISYLEKAWQKAEEADDEFSKYQVYSSRGWIFWMAAEFERAIDGWEKSGESQFGRHIVRIVQRKSALAQIYFYLGQIEKSLQLSQEAHMLARDSGLMTGYVTIYSSQGLAHFGKGDFKEAEQYHLKSKDLTNKVHNYVWQIYANKNLADIYFELNNFEAAEHHYQAAVQTHEQTKLIPQWGHVAVLGVARAGVMLGDTEVDLENLRAITDREDANSTKGWKARYMGEILLNMGGQYMPEAESWIKKAISANTETHMRFMLARDYALYCEFFKRQDNLPQAREQMNKAVEIMKECNADGWVEKYEKELAEFS